MKLESRGLSSVVGGLDRGGVRSDKLSSTLAKFFVAVPGLSLSSLFRPAAFKAVGVSDSEVSSAVHLASLLCTAVAGEIGKTVPMPFLPFRDGRTEK